MVIFIITSICPMLTIYRKGSEPNSTQAPTRNGTRPFHITKSSQHLPHLTPTPNNRLSHPRGQSQIPPTLPQETQPDDSTSANPPDTLPI